MGRILALDWGTKRTGVAVSDPLRIIAGGLDTVPTASLEQWLTEYLSSNGVDIIVIGKALKTDGTPSDTLPHASRLAARLAARYPAIRVEMFDERYTSALAHRAMIDGGMKKSDRRDKATVDRISATIILQGYMESRQYKEIKK